jgi:hypothetical protein
MNPWLYCWPRSSSQRLSIADSVAKIWWPLLTVVNDVSTQVLKVANYLKRREGAFPQDAEIGTRITLLAADKPDRFFTVIKFWIDKTSGVALELNTGVPSYHVDDEEGRTHLLIQLPIEADEHRWCLWRPDLAGFDSRSIFEGALIEE